MQPLLRVLVGSALVLMTHTALAASPFYFKGTAIGIAGTGCPAGSFAVGGEGTTTLSIIFDRYDAGKNAPSASGLIMTACNLHLPVHKPSGFRIGSITARWQGTVQGLGRFKRRYYVFGQPIPPFITNFYLTNFISNDTFITPSAMTDCNAVDFILKVNSNIRAMSNPSHISLDTADFTLVQIPC